MLIEQISAMVHEFETKQFIKSDLQTVWTFMSSPKNLAKNTPPYMGFHILSDLKNTNMYPGQIISYKVSPIAGIKMRWVTEITHVVHPTYFVDEQRFGPYTFWHHKHFLAEVPGGVEMTDIVHYKVPLGFIGNIINQLFIKAQLKKIFDYRFQKVEELFNK